MEEQQNCSVNDNGQTRVRPDDDAPRKILSSYVEYTTINLVMKGTINRRISLGLGWDG